jgi:hypothetical protein
MFRSEGKGFRDACPDLAGRGPSLLAWDSGEVPSLFRGGRDLGMGCWFGGKGVRKSGQ